MMNRHYKPVIINLKYTYLLQGQIAIDEGPVEIAKRGMTHYEKQLKVYEAIGVVENAADARYNIAHAKSKCGGGKSDEDRLKTWQELYEMQVAKYGEEHELTICGGMYAIELVKAFRGDEARELLTKLLATSNNIRSSSQNY